VIEADHFVTGARLTRPALMLKISGATQKQWELKAGAAKKNLEDGNIS